jgi:hypothetical protein
MSAPTAYQRFFTVMRRLPPDWARLRATVDYRDRLALVAEHRPDGAPELVGVGRYAGSKPHELPEFGGECGREDPAGACVPRQMLAASAEMESGRANLAGKTFALYGGNERTGCRGRI